jgi:hypothetical protein
VGTKPEVLLILEDPIAQILTIKPEASGELEIGPVSELVSK